LLLLSCKEKPNKNIDKDNGIKESKEETIKIGDKVAGGLVFYIAPTPTDLDGDGKLDKGLVCALSDHDGKFIYWGCMGEDLPNVPNVLSNPNTYTQRPYGLGAEIGDGMNNTKAILSDCPDAPAALAAKTLGEEWFLPSISELNEILVNKVALDAALLANGGDAFGSKVYWTSSERNSRLAWAIYFGSVNIAQDGKSGLFNYVRAIKAF
jgi:hypothetical protein